MFLHFHDCMIDTKSLKIYRDPSVGQICDVPVMSPFWNDSIDQSTSPKSTTRALRRVKSAVARISITRVAR